MLLPEPSLNPSTQESNARPPSQLRASGPLTAELFRRLALNLAKLFSVFHDEGRRRAMADAGIQIQNVRRAERLPVMIEQDRNPVLRGRMFRGQLEGRIESCIHETTLRLPFLVSSSVI